ncbi:MAG TPA: family 78 glycoside hydrolase catalytic domain [Rhizomicrobium sp.]|nr:family 78 glycoside hydrolase catalytic domain [Rhizomicrobium sp.]
MSKIRIAAAMLLGFAGMGSPVQAAGDLTLAALRVEAQENPVGIDARTPRFSWQTQSQARGMRQAAYEIQVTDCGSGQAANRIWTSGKVSSDQSTQLSYGGPSLQSRKRYCWQARVWDTKGRQSDWSAPAYWEMGLLSPRDWSADWIEPRLAEDTSKPQPAPMLRKAFQVEGPIARARAYVTSHGLYEFYLNGQRVSDRLFTPGWTDYAKRLQYQTYDVTAQLKNGANAVGAILGDGWYRGMIGFNNQRNRYGQHLALLMQIEITYADGHTQRIVSDGSWKAATGPIRASQIYAGEIYDARLERTGWSDASYDDRDWSAVGTIAASKDVLVAQVGPPVRRISEITPVKIFKSPSGAMIADMGQNLTGWVRLRVKGPAGTTITLRHGEVLDAQGNLYIENLRAAEQTVQYTLKGGGDEVFEPHFTFQGFRYVALDGYPGNLEPGSVTGIVIHSDVAPAGEFETSSELINRLQHNILWSQKGNFLDIPTDCPQRDERLGWTGDAEVFSSTAAFNTNVEGFFTKWLADLSADQEADGAVPHVIPDVLSGAPSDLQRASGAAGWGDAATIIPWNLYLAYADKRLLAAQYDSMAKWARYEQNRAGDKYIWSGDFQFGDWLDFFNTAKHISFGSTSPDLVATAFYAHSVDIMQRTARVLGKKQDADRYAELLAKIQSAFRSKFVADNGQVGEGTQTAYVLALDFDLLPETIRPVAAKKLAEDVRSRGHLTTGFLGTPHLLNVLSRFGYLNEAYLLLNREDYPSWLYPVKHGATTIWERWDGIKPDGSFEDKGMNSFNHYAYGAVGDWMYRVMGGIDIDPAAPGYKHVLVHPRPGGNFTHVKASHVGPFGVIRTDWRIDGQAFSLSVDVPPNSMASVRLPNAKLVQVTESGKSLKQAVGLSEARQTDGDVVVEAGSGHYEFRYPLAQAMKQP